MRYAILPLVVAALGIWLGRRVLTVLVIFAYLSVEGFLKLLSNYHRVVHVGIDIVVLSVAGAWVLDGIVSRRTALPALPWVRLIGLYGLWVVLEVLNPNSPGLIPSIASFKIHLAMIPLYFITAAVVRDRAGIVTLVAGLTAIAMIPYVAALAQYALGPESVLDLSPRFWQNISGYHEWRPFGTSAVPGGAAVYAFLVVPLALALFVAPREFRRVRTVAVLCILLASGAFVVSGVRQLLLGCLLAILVMAALVTSRGRSRAVAGLIMVLVLGAGAYVGVQTFLKPMATEAVRTDPRVPEIWRERSVTDRLLTLAQTGTYASARANPLPAVWHRFTRYPFGAGLGRTGSAGGAFQQQIMADPASAQISREVGWSDNFFADMTVETGIPGMVMLTTILLGMIVGAARLARRADDPLFVAVSAAIAGLFVSYLAMSWGSQPLLSNPLTAYFWMLSGALAAMRRIEEQPPPAEELAAMEAAAEPLGLR